MPRACPARSWRRSRRSSTRLAAPTQRMLRGAAVTGDPFEADVAIAAAGVEEDAAMDAFDALLDAGLVRPTDVPRRFRFRHPLVRRAVYESAPGGWLLGAHARAAQSLAARGAPAAARAHHVEFAARAGDAEAVAVLTEAGMAGLLRAPASAARWLSAALRILPADAPLEQRRRAPARAGPRAGGAGPARRQPRRPGGEHRARPARRRRVARAARHDVRRRRAAARPPRRSARPPAHLPARAAGAGRRRRDLADAGARDRRALPLGVRAAAGVDAARAGRRARRSATVR